jgi:hypothetical protein
MLLVGGAEINFLNLILISATECRRSLPDQPLTLALYRDTDHPLQTVLAGRRPFELFYLSSR